MFYYKKHCSKSSTYAILYTCTWNSADFLSMPFFSGWPFPLLTTNLGRLWHSKSVWGFLVEHLLCASFWVGQWAPHRPGSFYLSSLLYPQCLALCLLFSQCSVSICGINEGKVKADKERNERECLSFSCVELNLSGIIYSFVCLFNMFFFLWAVRYMKAGITSLVLHVFSLSDP